MDPVVGGAFLSAFLNVVFDRLASPEVVNLIRGKKLDKKLLQRLETTLKMVRAVLDDAEKKQISDSNVKDWLNDLKDALYEADDLLDEVSTKAATQKKVNNFFSRFSNAKIATKLEDIVVRLESVLKLKESLDLKEITAEYTSLKAPSTSLDDGSHIYGRDQDKEAIIRLLLEDRSDGEQVSVIPIVGIGGVGKTSLAQSVYNDENLKLVFDLKAWVYVSDKFDIMKVTKAMIEGVTQKPCELNDLNSLQLHLMEELEDKKFLIVLDDVWIEDYIDWRGLKKPFQRGIMGSKILVTTRNENVASVIHTVQPYHLKELSNEDCWLVFTNHACLSSEFSDTTTTLEKIAREIVKKCNGLPLAAQSLGGMLRRKLDISDWSNILKSDIWELPESMSKIIPALRISYHYLPAHVKRCFVYCSLYPKDYEFQKNELILLWMAEDLLKPPRKGKTFEDIGYEYFDYLVSRSFFQPSRCRTGGNYFVMHDLMHDLATSLGVEFYLRLEELGRETKIDTKTRHLSFNKFSDTIHNNSKVFGRVKLRTFLPINCEVSLFNNEKASIIISKLKYLRVLSFHGFKSLDVLPDSIGELIHLRYLNLSGTNIETLPETLFNLYNLQTLKLSHCRKLTKFPSGVQNLINLCHLDLYRTRIETLPESMCNLYNLQTLKLSHCKKLTMLPRGMQNLVNLRHLEIDGTPLQEMPGSLGKLNHLQHLDFFIVGKNEENEIKEMRGLPNLHGSLSIKNLENVTKIDEALEARIMDKKHINSLYLQWSEYYNSRNSKFELDLLCKLQAHPGLKLLSIHGYKGTKFPDWVGNSSYRNMTHLSLSNCQNCCMLPSLGQLPSLKELDISKLNMVEIIDEAFYGKDFPFVTFFPSLESLKIYDMPYWKVWRSTELDAFPLLKRLVIRNCPKLRGDLPNHLLALESLTVEDCKLLVSSLPRAPSIRRLEISKSNKLVLLHEFPFSVESMEIKGSPMVVESMIEAITNIEPTCLKSLTLRHCSSAVSFPSGRLPASLKTLKICDLKKLEFPTQHKHELLESLSIWGCDSLTSLPLVTFPNLKCLEIENCENMESLLVSESESHKKLSSFKFRNCPNLKSLPDQMSSLFPKLENLEIYKCPEIESFPKGGMPSNLRKIVIGNCEKLLSGVAWPSMDMLTHLTVWGPCDGIMSFPKEGLLPPSIVSLRLFHFSSLKTLDYKGLLHLTSLQKLEIDRCQKLENMEEEKLPLSLNKLSIHGCPLLQKDAS